MHKDAVLLQMTVGGESRVRVEWPTSDGADNILAVEILHFGIAHDEQHIKHVLHDCVDLKDRGCRLHMRIPVIVEPLLKQGLAGLNSALLLDFHLTRGDLPLVLADELALGKDGGWQV